MKQVWIAYTEGDEEELEYKIEAKDTDKGERFRLVRAGGNWAKDVLGEVAAQITDTGNEVKIKVGCHKLELDYSEFEALMILGMSQFTTSFEIYEAKRVLKYIKPQ